MKRILPLVLTLLMMLSVLSTFAACNKKTDWNGPRKAKNYRYATQLKADLMTLNGNVTDSCIYAHANYASYPFFSTSKNTGYANLYFARTPNNFFIFRLN